MARRNLRKKYVRDAKTIRRVLAPLDYLTSKQRQVVIEFHYYETAAEDIAVAFNINLSRVYALLAAAERTLVQRRLESVVSVSPDLKHNSRRGRTPRMPGSPPPLPPPL